MVADDTAGPINIPSRKRGGRLEQGRRGLQFTALPQVGPPTEALLENLPLQGDGLILDLACGVGSPTLEAARRNPAARKPAWDRTNATNARAPAVFGALVSAALG